MSPLSVENPQGHSVVMSQEGSVANIITIVK